MCRRGVDDCLHRQRKNSERRLGRVEAPRIYAGEGALRRSGNGWSLISRFSAGDQNRPRLKRLLKESVSAGF